MHHFRSNCGVHSLVSATENVFLFMNPCYLMMDIYIVGNFALLCLTAFHARIQDYSDGVFGGHGVWALL